MIEPELPQGLKHFVDLRDLSRAEMRRLLDAAHARKAENQGRGRAAVDADAPLRDRTLAMIFEKPSTRTRLSFDAAITQLGGRAVVLNHTDTQLGRGETVADTARVMSAYADMVMIRTGEHDKLLAFARNAQVPVINGLTNFNHPCQIIADLQTFEAHKGPISGKKVAWFGDGNNVAVSFIHAAALLDFELHLALAPEFTPPQSVLDWAAAQGANVTISEDVAAVARGADAVVTDCWVSMADAPETAEARARAFAPFRVDGEIMGLGNDPIFMHCLPAYRGNEVTPDVIDGPQSVVFEEAENRTYAQKAVLMHCFGLLKD